MPKTARPKPDDRLLAIDSEAPDFSLPASTGENVHLASFRGKKNVLLVFYPKNNTPG